MRNPKIRMALVVLFAVLFVDSTLGCLGGDSETRERSLSSLTIDFMGEEGSINPGNLTVWENISGLWVQTTFSNQNVTEYVFLNISAANCLEQMEQAGELAGFEIEKVYYATLSSWFITTVDGSENELGGHNWQFWVNGEYAIEGADKIWLEEGDQVIWRYTASTIGDSDEI